MGEACVLTVILATANMIPAVVIIGMVVSHLHNSINLINNNLTCHRVFDYGNNSGCNCDIRCSG